MKVEISKHKSLLSSAISFLDITNPGYTSFILGPSSKHNKSKQGTDQDAGIPHMKLLVDYLKQEKTNNINNNDIESSQHSFEEQSLCPDDIAGILLPYAVKQLIYFLKQNKKEIVVKEKHAIIWEAFSLSIKHLMSLDHFASHDKDNNSMKGSGNNNSISVSEKKSSHSIIGSCLTQSALQKVIPFAAKIAFITTKSTSDESKTMESIKDRCSRAAAISFVYMNILFRPTMDQACKMIHSVAELALGASLDNKKVIENGSYSLQSSTKSLIIWLPYSYQQDIIHSSLDLFSRLCRQNVASPKKIFTLLTTDNMLPSLSKISRMQVFSNTSKSIQTNSNGYLENCPLYKLVRNIIWEGLFHPDHHIQGFVSACFTEVNIIGDEIESNTVDDEDEMHKNKKNKADKNEKTTRRGKKKIQRSCYQQTLFEIIDQYFIGSSKSTIESLDSIINDATSSSRIFLSNDILATAYILPMIFECFIEQSTVWANKNSGMDISSSFSMEYGLQSGSKRKFDPSENNAHATLTRTQFRFWCTITKPLLQKLFTISFHDDLNSAQNTMYKTITETCFLQSFSTTLRFLIDYDIYLPAYEDIGNVHFNVLQRFTDQTLDRADYSLKADFKSQKISIDVLEQYKVELQIFQRLLNLNHHLIHEKLHRLLYIGTKYLADEQIFCAHIGSDNQSEYGNTEASILLSLIVDTYGKLRQIGHLISSLLQTPYLKLRPSNEFVKIFFSDSSTMKVLSNAIQKCPSGQVEDIWQIFMNSIISSSSNDDKQNLGWTMQWKIDLFVLFIRSIHIEKQNALKIRSLCEQSIDNTTTTFLIGIELERKLDDITQTETDKLNFGLCLSGWFVDLHTRCCFWLEPEDIVDLEESSILSKKNSKLLALLLNAAELVTKNSSFQNISKSPLVSSIERFQHLACHRIQQLHSIIHIQQHLEGNSDEDNDEKKSSKMIAEAQLLTNLAFSATSDQFIDQKERNTSSPWQILAESVSIWETYCNQEHISSFLRWLFSILAITTNEKMLKSSKVLLLPQNQFIDNETYEVEKELNLSLIQDASFFEVTKISQNYAPACLICVIDVIRKANFQSKGNKNTSKLIKDIFPSSLESNWEPLNTGELAELPLRLEKMKKFKNESTACENINQKDIFERILKLIRILSAAPLDILSDKSFIIDTLVRLDFFISAIILTRNALGNEEKMICIQIMCTSRYLAATILADVKEEEKNISILSSSIISIGKYFVNSMTTVLDSNRLGIDNSIDDLILSTADIMEATALFCITSYEKDSNLFESLLEFSCSLVNKSPCTVIIRSVLRRIHLIGGTDRNEKKYLLVSNRLVNLIVCTRFKSCSRDILSRGNIDSTELTEELLLLSEALNCWSLCRELTSLEKDIEVENIISNEIGSIFSSITSTILKSNNALPSQMERACFYFLTSLCTRASEFFHFISSADLFKQVTAIICKNYSSRAEYQWSILDSAICSLIQEANLEQIEPIVLLIAKDASSFSSINIENAGALIHVFSIICDNVKGQENRDLVSETTSIFLHLSFEVLQTVETCESYNRVVLTSLNFLKLAIEKRDIFHLKSPDIATMISQLSYTFKRMTGINHNKNDTIQYRAISSILVSLLKHYPKQVYTCVPNFVSILHCMLEYILKPNEKSNDTNPNLSLSEQIKEFAKVCELLESHKDIFKKHIIGLLLCFSDALSSGITTFTKKNVTPAIYSLLDVCSNFEVDQLNALMNVTNKALFRVVYQNYQRTHCYKGQF